MNWDDLYSGFKDFANRAATKINQSADIATLQVKLSLAERKLEEAYAALGKAAYRHFTEEENRSERVAACISAVQSVQIEVRALKRQIAEAKRRAGMENDPQAKEQTAKARTEDQEPAKAKAQTAAHTAQEEAEETPAQAEAAAQEPAQESQTEAVISAEPERVITAVSNAEDAVEVTVETVE